MTTGARYVGPASTDIPGIGNKVAGVRSNALDPLYKWRRYYSKRGTRTVNVICIGDSITWGQGVAVGSPPNFDGFTKTIPFQLQRFLNRAESSYFGTDSDFTLRPYTPPTVNMGYHLRSMLALGGVPSPWRIISGSLTQINRGTGLTSTQLNAGTRIAFTAPAANNFEWIYEDGASNLGTPNISIYAGDYDPNRTGRYTDNFGMTMNTGLAQFTRSNGAVALPTRGKYTFEFGITSGTPVVDGIYVGDNDLGHSVRVYNWAWTGTSTLDFMPSNTQANTSAASMVNILGGAGAVDLIIIYLGAGDYSVQNGTLSPAIFTTNLIAIIDKYRAIQSSKSIPILLVSHFARYDVTPTTYAWSLFEQAMRNVLASRSDVDHLMLSPYFPISQAADTDEDLVDSSGVHFTEGGAAIAAQAIAQKLMTPWVLA